jgi:transposase-like protein
MGRILSKKKSPSVKPPWRYPPDAAGIQVNHCKNPTCANFGVPPKEVVAKGPGGARPIGVPKKKAEPGDYKVTATGRGKPSLFCELCEETIPMQSNLAIAEELMRISAYLEPPQGPACTNDTCAFKGVPQSASPTNYVHFGTNNNGTPRYRCKACQKVFSHGGKSTRRQRVTHPNRDVFEHLVNCVPIRRIIKLLKISPGTLYQRLNFIWLQCRLFAGERERSLLYRQDLGKRYIAVDRQALMVNWSTRKDRRNTLMLSCGSADLETSYVFCVQLNYDPEMDAATVLAEMPRFGDDHLAQPFRRFARLWLPKDYEDAVKRASSKKRPEPSEGLPGEIEALYANALDRTDIEAGDGPQPGTRTPAKGMQIHEQVAMSAHFQFVARLLRNAEKIRFYTDFESGLRAAFMAAFKERIRERTADAFYVTVLKDVSVGIKRQKVRKAQERFAQTQIANPRLSDHEIELLLLRKEMARMAPIGKWDDRWLRHPLPDMREPEKRVCWLTDIDKPEKEPGKREDQLNHAAWLYRKAALHPIDRFFMQVRRGVTVAERGLVSASSDRRQWFGKNAYVPGNLAKLLEIYRVYFNYCEVGKDRKTPAMRLGLAKGPVASEDILYFTPWHESAAAAA